MTRADIIRKQAQTVAKLHEQGVYYFQNQQYNKARQCFQDACNIFPEEPQLLNALALALLNTAEFEEAKINYEKAIKFSKGRPSIELLDQYGFLLTHIGAKKEAIKIYEKIVGLNPNFLKGWVKLGDLYVFEHNELKAIECWKNVKRLEPESFIALRGLSNCYHALCDWDNADVVDKALKQITQKCISEDKLGPLAHHSAFLFEKSGSFMREVAENHNKELLESFESVGIKLEEKVRVKKYSRLRVGYLSSALSRHATAYLIQDLFKHHDTAKFEIFIFAGKLNLPCGSFDKIKETVEHFYDVCEMTDVDIARFIQDKDLDVLIDLDGIILDNKQAALTFKPAPIQITWLGMPATLGAPWIDYILSDNVISPPKYNSHYTETVLRMPDSYFFNSFSSLEIDETDKEALGLPEDKFIFASFNVNRKIDRESFLAWCQILKQVENSVLWMMIDDEQTLVNLSKAMEENNIDPSRIITAERVPLMQHIARLKHADLMLDCFICCAHTTAAEALWSELPIITKIGETFHSRVAASVLTAAKMENMITHTTEEFIDRAVEIAQNPDRLAELKDHLESNKHKLPLFDQKKWVRGFEGILKNITS